MAYQIVSTTAEDIIAVVDAIIAKPEEAADSFIEHFTDLSNEKISNALLMAQELELLTCDIENQRLDEFSFLARLLVSAQDDIQRAAILRLVLEQYTPYIEFKSRYAFTNSLDLAAKQVKILNEIATNARDIRDTLVSLATYSKSMINEGANTFKLNQDDYDYIEIIELAVYGKASDDQALYTQFGKDYYTRIDREKVFNPLSEAFSVARSQKFEHCLPIIYSSNAFESFLGEVAEANNIILKKAGIINKSNELKDVLSKKHRGMIEYLGQIRNAAEHGADNNEGNKVWEISYVTSVSYPMIVAELIKNILLYIDGKLSV